MELIDIQNCPAHLSPALRYVLDYLAQTDISSLPNQQHEIDGKDFFVNIFTYSTAAANERIWEAHRQYIDVHLVLDGVEVVNQASIATVKQGEYDETRDYLPVAQDTLPQTTFTLRPDLLAVFYPQDAHQTGVAPDWNRQKIRKAVFKIKLNQGN